MQEIEWSRNSPRHVSLKGQGSTWISLRINILKTVHDRGSVSMEHL